MRLRSGLTLALGLALIGASAVSAPATGAETVAPTPVLVGDYTDSQWNLVATSLEAVHVAGHTGEGVTIAILDSDYDGTHPEIAPNVVESFVVEGTTVKEVAPQEMNSSETHGTHVAGIAAGVADGVGMTGVAPDADLILGAVAWEKSDPDLWPSVIAGLDHVAGRADVINLSLGQPEVLLSPELAEALCAAVGNATAKGSVVVIAAGNSGVDGNPAMLPAGCETAVTVTALDPDLSLAYFSSFEGFVSVSAPGTDILGPMARAALQGTSFAVEPRPLIPMSGTSMAAPFVAGVAALVLEAFPDMTPVEVRQRLTSTAQDRGAKGYDPDYGYGAVDPAAAVGEDALPAPTPTAFPSYLSFQPMDLETDSYVAAQWSPGGAGGEIEGYTITALGYGSDDSWTVDAREVRNLMEVEPAAAWYALTVHTSEGSYTTPYWPVPFAGGQSGIADLRARWVEGNRLRVFWTLAEPVPAGTVLTVDVMASAPQGFDAFRRVTIDPRGRISGSRTIDVAAPGPSPEVRSGLRQYAAGSWAVAGACLGNNVACLSADVSPKYPVAVTLTPTGRRTGTLALMLNMAAMEGCPVRAGAPRCEGVVARVSVGGRDLVARFNTQGVAFLPVDRAPGASVVPAVVTVPALERGGPFRLNIVTENDGSFG